MGVRGLERPYVHHPAWRCMETFHPDVSGGGVVQAEYQVKLRTCTIRVVLYKHFIGQMTSEEYLVRYLFSCRQTRLMYAIHSIRVPIIHTYGTFP